MQKACFLQGKCSSRVAPVLLPLPPADPLVSGFPLGRLKGHRVPSPPALPGAQPGPACPASLRHTSDTLDTQPCVSGYPWLWYSMGAKLPVSSSHGRWEQFDKKYLSQLLMRKSAYRLRDEIWDVYYKLNIRDAISFVDQVQAVVVSKMALAGEVPLMYDHMCTLWPGSEDLPSPAGSLLS